MKKLGSFIFELALIIAYVVFFFAVMKASSFETTVILGIAFIISKLNINNQ